jgi:hypothetical protein
MGVRRHPNGNGQTTMEQDVFTVPEYCSVEKVSRSKLYEEWARDEGVEFFRRGSKILISNEARVRYRQQLERKAREEREAASARETHEQVKSSDQTQRQR